MKKKILKGNYSLSDFKIYCGRNWSGDDASYFHFLFYSFICSAEYTCNMYYLASYNSNNVIFQVVCSGNGPASMITGLPDD